MRTVGSAFASEYPKPGVWASRSNMETHSSRTDCTCHAIRLACRAFWGRRSGVMGEGVAQMKSFPPKPPNGFGGPPKPPPPGKRGPPPPRLSRGAPPGPTGSYRAPGGVDGS